jgi:glycine/D-amino acid oxidase-like deaminating enzyme
MVGGADERVSRRHADPRLMTKKADRLAARFHELFPAIALEIAYRWAGTFTATPDGLPYIGRLPEHAHAWLALGYGGNGVTFSMIAATLIRDAWLRVPNSDARLFSFDRRRQGDD